MPSKILRQPEHVDALATLLRSRKLPLTVSWVQGAPLSSAQQRLAQRWYNDIAAQLGDTDREEVRAQCKRDFGVPMLCAENSAFASSWAVTFAALPYAAQVAGIRAFDLPVTRIMTAKQMSQYMDAVQRAFGGRGLRLTDPEAQKYEEEFA